MHMEDAATGYGRLEEYQQQLEVWQRNTAEMNQLLSTLQEQKHVLQTQIERGRVLRDILIMEIQRYERLQQERLLRKQRGVSEVT